jgi:hypothetical protein
MLYHPPKFTYSGLTIILSNPSRFDQTELISAQAGAWFNNNCLRPDFNRYQCDIRLADDDRPLLTGTKVVLCMGLKAQQLWMKVDTNLDEQRGSPVLRFNDIVYISTYLPQDCMDMKNYESYLNTELSAQNKAEEAETKKEKGERAEKRRTPTDRANYRFWCQKDTRKAIDILKRGLRRTPPPEYIIYPSSKTVIDVLRAAKDKIMYVDIETDIIDRHLKCFGFAFDTGPIYVVPFYRFNRELAYDNCGAILGAIAIAMQRNLVVTHNGQTFDLFVLMHDYGIPFRKAYDTLIATHRCFPSVEKSLGHCVSLWTHEPYHKDEGILQPKSDRQEHSLWSYNAKDVFTTRLVKEAIDAYAATIPGLTASIEQAMSSIRPYLTTTMTGILYDEEKLKARVAYNDRVMMQMMRVADILVGKEAMEWIRGSGKGHMLGSSQQCVRYFHTLLGYPVVSRSQKTKAPSLDEPAILKLKLKHDNPLLDAILEYRGRQKETGSLLFTSIDWR